MTEQAAHEPRATRMKAPARRELVLEAATHVFGERGYFGTTTDAVAKAAGVSQPYVVRMFGTKEELFLAVLHRALDRVVAAFREIIADGAPPTPSGRTDLQALLGHAYAELLADRGLLLCLMHGFLLGSEPEIGAHVRAGFAQIYRLLREEAGFSAAQTHEFLAGGMLLNTIVGLRMIRDYDADPAVRELLDSVLPTKLDLLRAVDAC